MLVLSRKPAESILIGDNVEITVIQIHGNRVRIGINAPHHVSITRTELASFNDLQADCVASGESIRGGVEHVHDDQVEPKGADGNSSE